MKVFVDTSAFYASLTPDDNRYGQACQVFDQLAREEADLFTTNYVLLECASLIQKRRGFSYAERFLDKSYEVMQIVWVDESLQKEALSMWKKEGKRELSLVDCASFAAMRRAGIRRALAFDSHFAKQGFETIP